jgi:hypothetical protein
LDIVLCSLFANSVSSGHLDYYIPQVISLKEMLPADRLRFIWVWGDSQDDTGKTLGEVADREGLDATIVEHSHGLGVFPSTESSERFKVLSGVGNAGLEHLRETDDCIVWIESDLQWDGETIVSLVDHVKDGLDIVVPFIRFAFTGQFYDIFAYRGLDEKRFLPDPPYHSEYTGKLMELSSAGSCVVMKGECARKARFTPESCFVGLLQNLRKDGYHLWMDPELEVVHPRRSYD